MLLKERPGAFVVILLFDIYPIHRASQSNMCPGSDPPDIFCMCVMLETAGDGSGSQLTGEHISLGRAGM